MKVMREYKLKPGPDKELTDAEVFKYKDFGKLTTNYEQTLKRLHKRPLYKDPKAFLALLLALVILWLVVRSGEKPTKFDRKIYQTEEVRSETPTTGQ